MSELVAVGYPDAATAERALEAAMRLEDERLLELEDAVVVEHRQDGRVLLHPGVGLGALESAAGALLGGAIGTLFLAPLLGVAIGAAAGATRAALDDLGIPDDFMRRLGASLPPGRAALILLVRGLDPDEVPLALRERGGQVLRSSITAAGEEQLRAAGRRR